MKFLRETIEESDSKGNVLSKEQCKFFQYSKIRNTQGKLMVCYHYTDKSFDTFDKSTIGSSTGNRGYFGAGFYFTSMETFGKGYGKNKMEVYLNIENPFCFEDLSANDKDDYLAYVREHMTEEQRQNSPIALRDEEPSVPSYIYDDLTADNFHQGRFIDFAEYTTDFAKSRGYDGIVSEWGNEIREIVVFEPNQIKSITNKEPSNSNNINEKLEPLDPEIEELADADAIVSQDPYDVRNYLISSEALKVLYLPKEDWYVIIDPYLMTHWDVMNDLYRQGFSKTKDFESYRWYFIPTSELEQLEDGYLGEYTEEDFKHFVTYAYKTGYMVCLEKDDFKGTSLCNAFGKPIKVDTLYNILHDGSVEALPMNESASKIDYQHILDVEHRNLTNWLRKYGFEIELITEYDFEGSNAVGMFLNSEQTDATIFPIAINIPAILENARELSYDEYSFNNEIAYGFRGTLWHEAGHGIFEYLDSIYDLDDLNEEDVVEEFAEYQEDSELFDILTQYNKEYGELSSNK